MPAVEELVFQTEKFFKFFIDILETLFLIKLRGFVSRMFLFPKILPHALWTASKDPEAQPGRWGREVGREHFLSQSKARCFTECPCKDLTQHRNM